MVDPRSTLPGLAPSYLEVSYGGVVLSPSPLINHAVSFTRNEAGNRETVTTTRTLTGQILTSGIGYEYVRQKQRQLEEAFARDNLEFKIVASAYHPALASGTAIESGVFPNVASIDIAEDLQFNRLDYSIVLEDIEAASGIPAAVSNLTNSWQYTENEAEAVIDISHSVSAQGVNTAQSGLPSNALDNAITRVSALLGLANAPSGFPGYAQPGSGVNSRFYELTTTREESLDTQSASYSVSERFKLVSGVLPFIDDRTSQVQINEKDVINIQIQGTIRGLGRTNDGAQLSYSRTSGGTGFANAVSGFNNLVRPALSTDALEIYTRNGGIASLAVDNPQSVTISESPALGTIGYSISYTDDPTKNLPSGISELTVTLSINDPVVQNATIAAPFSAVGPILQRMFTTTEGSYVINCNVVAKNTGNELLDTNRAIEVAEQEIIKRQPNPSDYNVLRLTGRNQSIDRLNRSINASFTWTFTQSIGTVPADTGPMTLGRIS